MLRIFVLHVKKGLLKNKIKWQQNIFKNHFMKVFLVKNSNISIINWWVINIVFCSF
jgi:hypothetical protein